VRHPIYTGIILATVALAIIKGTVTAIIGALLIAPGFWVKRDSKKVSSANSLARKPTMPTGAAHRCSCLLAGRRG
jgi:hypothetical protein